MERLGFTGQGRVHASFLFSNLLVLLLTPFAALVPHVCLFQHFLGIPCPGCGITTAVLGLLQLRFNLSWLANPAGVLVAAVILFQVLARPVALLKPDAGPDIGQCSRHISSLALAGLLMVWITRLAGGLLNGSN